MLKQTNTFSLSATFAGKGDLKATPTFSVELSTVREKSHDAKKRSNGERRRKRKEKQKRLK